MSVAEFVILSFGVLLLFAASDVIGLFLLGFFFFSGGRELDTLYTVVYYISISYSQIL